MTEIERLEALIKEIDAAILDVLANGTKFNTGATSGTGAGVTRAGLRELREAKAEAENKLRYEKSCGIW